MEKRTAYPSLRDRDFSSILAALLLVAPSPLLFATEQDDSELQDDREYREELGVNRFTTPSIDELFGILDSLKPIPATELERPVDELSTEDRARYALAFGVLIADGFLDVEVQNGRDFDALGREMLRRARGLGVESYINRHSKRVLDLARQGRWQDLRKELVLTQKDAERALLALKDEEMVHLLSLGGWLRGLEIATASVVATYSAERAEKLRKLDLLDYYLDRLSTLGPRSKKRPLVQSLTSGLENARQLLGQNGPVTIETAAKLRDLARALVDLIEKEPDQSVPISPK